MVQRLIAWVHTLLSGPLLQETVAASSKVVDTFSGKDQMTTGYDLSRVIAFLNQYFSHACLEESSQFEIT